jgi:uncharacterized phiE125 gp8 family phage protein
MTLRIVTAPAYEPLRLEEVKSWLRQEQDDQDFDLELLIASCRQYGENLTSRAWMTQTLELTLPGFPACIDICLPRPPLQWIESIKYVDLSGVLQTVDPAVYQVDSYREPGLVKPAYQQYWPSVRTSDYNPVRVRYVAGYAPPVSSPTDYSRPDNVPAAIRQWLKMKVATLFENREGLVIKDQVFEIPHHHFDGLLDQYRTSLFE